MFPRRSCETKKKSSNQITFSHSYSIWFINVGVVARVNESGATIKDLSKLQLAQNKAARFAPAHQVCG